MTDEKHADQQYNSCQQGTVFEASVSDISGQQQHDHGGRKRKQPGSFPEFRNLHGRQICQNALQEFNHDKYSSKCENEGNHTGLPGKEAEVEHLLTDTKSNGADDQQVIQQEQKMKGNDSDIRVDQKHHQRSENRSGQVLDRDAGQPGENQQGKQAEVEKLTDAHDNDGFPKRIPHVFPHRHIAQNKEGKRIQQFIDNEFDHSVHPFRSIM